MEVDQPASAVTEAPSADEDQATRKERFRKLWLAEVVDSFDKDLETLRTTDPSLSGAGGGSKLGLLIESLAAGEARITVCERLPCS